MRAARLHPVVKALSSGCVVIVNESAAAVESNNLRPNIEPSPGSARNQSRSRLDSAAAVILNNRDREHFRGVPVSKTIERTGHSKQISECSGSRALETAVNSRRPTFAARASGRN